MKTLKSKNSGFTLIELLIVIAIIAIIAGVVFVALNPLARFRDARNSIRWNDAQTLADAIRLYQFDNQGALPAGLDDNLKMLGTASSGCDVGCGPVGVGTSTSVFDMSNNLLLLHLDESSGAVSLQDSSGNNNNTSCAGSVCPTTGVVGKFGTAANFDGVNDCISSGNRLSFAKTDDHSYEAWIKVSALPSSWYGLIIDNMSSALTIAKSGSLLKLGVLYGNGGRLAYSPTSLSLNTWYHVVATYVGATAQWNFYINGQLDGTAVIDQAVAWNRYFGFKIGCWTSGPSYFFPGTIDEAVIYSRALTPQEILQHYQANLPLGSMINSGGATSSTAATCLDLSSTLSKQLPKIPVDPSIGSSGKTYYAIRKANNKILEVQACGAENGVNIKISK